MDPIKLCPRLTAKFLTTSYKSKIIRFKLDEDPLHHQIYFLTLEEVLDMIFDLVHPNMSPLISLYGMYQNPFIYRRNMTNSR